MPYVEPPTFVADTTATADDVNILSDDIRYLKGVADGVTFSGVQVTRTASQAISTSTSTTLSFTAEVFDHGGWWSSGTDVTVPAGAIPDGFSSIIVHCEGELRFAASNAGSRILKFFVNGAAIEPGRQITAASGGDTTDFGLSRYLEVEAGDVITLRCYQNSGATRNASSVVLSVIRHAPAS